MTLYSALSQVLDAEVTVDTPAEVLRGYAHKNDVPLREVDRELSAGEITLELFEKLVEHTLVEPTFVCDYPVEVRPLTRQHRTDPRLAEARDLFVFCVELATGYSELVDPVVQRERLEAQSRLNAT